MTLRNFCFLLLCAVALGACKESTTSVEPNITIAELFPLHTGNEWNYKITRYDTSGHIIKKGSDTLFSIQVLEPVTYFEHSTFRTITNLDTSNPNFFYYRGTNSLWNTYSESGKYYDESLFTLSFNVGEESVTTDTTYSDGERRKTVFVLRSKNESVTTPAKTFSCYHYDEVNTYKMPGSSTFDTSSVTKLFFAPAVGWVKQIQSSNSNNVLYLTTVMELTSYTIK